MAKERENEVTDLLETIRAGDAGAADRLLPLVYDELRGLATAIFNGAARRHTLQPTALVHEAWMKMAGGVDRLNDRQHFFAVAARAMRQVLADHAKSKSREKRGGARRQVTLDDTLAAAPAVDLVDLHDALEELERLNERHSRVVELRVFGGLTVHEIADLLDISESTVKSDWRMSQAWLLERLEGA